MISSLIGLVLLGVEPVYDLPLEDQAVEASQSGKGKGKGKGKAKGKKKGAAQKSSAKKDTQSKEKKGSSKAKTSSPKANSGKPKSQPSSDRQVPPSARLDTQPMTSQRAQPPPRVEKDTQTGRPPSARKPKQGNGTHPSTDAPRQNRGPGALPGKPHAKHDWVVVKPAWSPEGWSPKLHQTRPSQAPQWSPKNWGRGYFVFSPPAKGDTVKVVEKDMSGARVSSNSCRNVRRSIDRRGSLKIGARASSYVSSYDNGFESAYADLGAGGVIGYRLLEPIGVEIGYSQYAPEMEFETSTRSQSTVQGSAQLYLFPWTRVSPFLSGGYTIDQFDIQDQRVTAQGVASGPHGGIGVEWALGQRLAFGVEGRYILYKNMDASDGLRDNALQVFGGLDLYF